MIKQRYGLRWMYALSKGVRGYYALLAVAGIATTVVNIGLTTVLKNLVDIAAGESGLSLWRNLIVSAGFVLLEGAAAVVTSLAYRLSTEKVTKKLRLGLSQTYYGSDLLAIEKRHAGEYLTNLTVDVESVSSCIPSLIRKTVGNGLSAVAAILYLFFLSWKMALVLLVSIPLLILCVAIFSPVLQKNSSNDKKNEENTRVFLQEILQKFTIFKVGVPTQFIYQKLCALLDKKIESAKRLGLAEGGSDFLNNIMGTTVTLISIGGGAYLATQGELLVGSLIAVVQLTNYIVWPFIGTGEIISQVNQSLASAKRLHAIDELEPEKSLAEDLERKSIALLRLNDLSFSYGEKKILDHVQADFMPDRIIGIVGESGSGKSTMLKVIAGLYKPVDGSVEAVCRDNTSYFGSMVPYTGIVPPDNLIFQDSIRANICMGRAFDEEKFQRCVQMANISDYIESLEEKCDTIIGDGKRALSSGQEQRIAIARILYQDAKLLLFDEPTANLDAESVAIFVQTLKRIVSGHICLIATHDKNLIKECGELYQVENAKLIKQ